jgi:hypothetical protein
MVLVKGGKKIIVIILFCCFLFSALPSFGMQTTVTYEKELKLAESSTEILEYSFSIPTVQDFEDVSCVYSQEADFYSIADGVPVLPVKLTVLEFNLGTEVLDISYETSEKETIGLENILSYGKISPRGTDPDEEIYDSTNTYPEEWVTYHVAGGLNQDGHCTYLIIRTYPARYIPTTNEIEYITNIEITISYDEPDESVIPENNVYDLLVLAPKQFENELQPLIDHKNDFDMSTKLVTLDKIDTIGRDLQEKIKYYIHEKVIEWGIEYVLLVGGVKGQSYDFYLPVRYSYVIPPDEQEYAEQNFITDVYYSDVFDSKGEFSSWDTNNNDVFSEWNAENQDEIDMYPDVYIGRLACRSDFEVKIMVNKIINYEKNKAGDWFNKFLMVAGDSYPDANGLNEGELIGEEAIDIMSDFYPVRLYARQGQDIDRYTVKEKMDPGCGFAYFCGHGNPTSWSTHFPPGDTWTAGYTIFDMIYLNNKEKLPVVVVGGCHNAQFDTTILNLFKSWFDDSIKYGTWAPRCWAWWLTVKLGGGAIATIADTGLGTHGREDTDKNGIPDYNEILDGWLELNFLAQYGIYGKDILGENHGDTLTQYLHLFKGANEKMDVKMVQQWILLGDPSLKIGGYE